MTTVTSVRPRLLYLEDDPVIAEMTCEVLAEAYEVEHVADGTAGRRRALDGRFDVMLIDRRLPGVDGAEIIAAVRTARITTPILVPSRRRSGQVARGCRARSRTFPRR